MARLHLLLCLSIPVCAAWQVAGARPALGMPRAAPRQAPLGPQMNSEEEGIRAGLVTEVPFEVRFSLGNLISASGGLLLLYCAVSYFANNGEADILQTLGFVYGIPALLGGLALKYAELPPVPVETTPAATAAREAKATKTQTKIFSDATRFCYGDAHMEEPLKALKLAPPGRGPPELVKFTETVSPTGGYSMGMTFYAPYTPFPVFKQRAKRYATFFGPNVRAELRKVDAQKRLVELALITVEEGESTESLERLEDGSLIPVSLESDAAAEAEPVAA